MADELGFLAGAKSFSEGINSGRKAGNEIGKSIEGVQQDVTDVAKQKAQERIRQQREAQKKQELAVVKALQEYQRRKWITDEEARVKIEFIRKYGAKEWDAVLKIKTEIERLDERNKKEFDADLAKARRVMWACYFVAAWVAYYLTWGYKG